MHGIMSTFETSVAFDLPCLSFGGGHDCVALILCLQLLFELFASHYTASAIGERNVTLFGMRRTDTASALDDVCYNTA